jgi:hypothetical protein
LIFDIWRLAIMRRTLGTLAAVLVLLGMSIGTANAQGLLTLGWLVNGGGTDVAAKYGTSSVRGNFGTGAFHGTYNHSSVGSPLYCLDVFHTFTPAQGTAGWTVTPQVVPPDPYFPPPWNTREAAWVYNTYGQYVTSARADRAKAAGVQLALWEISHEQDWRAHYLVSPWYREKFGSTSDFRANLSRSDLSAGGKGWWATNILSTLRGLDPSAFSDLATYYNPDLVDDVYTGKQGFLGKYDAQYNKADVPEPGSLLLLGLSLIGAAGLGWRKRRS